MTVPLSDEFVASPTVQKIPKHGDNNIKRTTNVNFNILNLQTSGTNNAGRGPVALRMAVKMSKVVKPVNGCMESRVLPKVS